MSAMPATEDAATPVASGVPPGVGWVYLQPPQVTLVHYRHKQSIGLGAAQIVLGSLCIILNVVDLAVGEYILGHIGYGFWCGALFIVTGSFGIAAGHSKTKCKVVPYMVLCIISASFTSAVVICGLISAVVNGHLSNDCHSYTYSYSYYYRLPCGMYPAAIAMESLLAVCGLIVASLFIWGSVLSCKVTPCCGGCCCGSCCGGCCCSTPDSFEQVLVPPNYAVNNVIHSTQIAQPVMPYQPVAPSACQPSLVPSAYQPKPMLTQTYMYASFGADPNREFFADDDYKY